VTKFNITPVPKPRMTQKDKKRRGVAPRPPVARYNAFKREVELLITPHIKDLNGAHITFHMPTPKSWGRAKMIEHEGTPHKSTPDLDNLLKALMDAMYLDDKCVHTINFLGKRWAREGAIEINWGIAPC
jgi:Holliday junction resolvase RusA-like endonuclease